MVILLWCYVFSFIFMSIFITTRSKGKKGKVDHAPQENIGRCSSPSYRPWARRWRTTNVCDTCTASATPRLQLPSSHKASPLIAGTKLYWLKINEWNCVFSRSVSCIGRRRKVKRSSIATFTWLWRARSIQPTSSFGHSSCDSTTALD